MDGEAHKRDHKWAGGQRGCDEFSELVGGISIRRGKLHPARHPDRCCGRCHAATERQRRCETMMCPTSSSSAEREVRFWKANRPCCFDLWAWAFGDAFRCPDGIANVCVLSALAQLIWKLATLLKCNDGPRSATLIREAQVLYLPPFLPPHSNGMGRRASPRMSQQDGNQRVLIKATNLQMEHLEAVSL